MSQAHISLRDLRAHAMKVGERISLPGESVDLVLADHVLEHIDRTGRA